MACCGLVRRLLRGDLAWVREILDPIVFGSGTVGNSGCPLLKRELRGLSAEVEHATAGAA